MAHQELSRSLNLGCGKEPKPGWTNVDLRLIPGATDLVADIRRLPFADNLFDQIFAENVLEHVDDPRPAIAELARILKSTSGSRVVVRVPALGSNAAHLDPTHRYLADLKHWQDLMLERFNQVNITSVGVRWRTSLSLVFIQRILISMLGWHDLAQCWVLTARHPRSNFKKMIYDRWWLDS